MSEKERSYIFYLYDILNAILKIQDYTSGMTFEKFLGDEKTQDAVLRNFEIIGEASNQVPAANEQPRGKPSGYQQKEEGMQKLVSFYYYPPLNPFRGDSRKFLHTFFC